MCGRFALFHSREEYLTALQLPVIVNKTVDTPKWCYNISPGTNVVIIQQQERKIELSLAYWGYAPKWWREQGKQPLINARAETASSSKMFSPLWNHERALVPASGWYEWKKSPDNPRIKQPYFIYARDKMPLFFAAFKARDKKGEEGGVVVLTAASRAGLKDIHDRRPLALTLQAAREWLDNTITPPTEEMLADVYSFQADEFAWHPVSSAIGAVRNDTAALIAPIDSPKI